MCLIKVAICHDLSHSSSAFSARLLAHFPSLNHASRNKTHSGNESLSQLQGEEGGTVRHYCICTERQNELWSRLGNCSLRVPLCTGNL